MRGAYVVGEPGVGKSAVVTELTQKVNQGERAKPFAHVAYQDEHFRTVAIQLGARHRDYPGTDRLSMSVQPKAIDWLAGAPAPFVFGEGDRLATTGFFDALEENCDEWWLVYLSAPPEVIEKRRAARGSDQDSTWLAGRRTKVKNLVTQWQRRLVLIDATVPVEAVAAQIRRQVTGFDWTIPATE